MRAPGWVSASILWPPGFEGQARLPRWQVRLGVGGVGKGATFSAPPGGSGLAARGDVRDGGCLGSGLVLCS